MPSEPVMYIVAGLALVVLVFGVGSLAYPFKGRKKTDDS